MYNQVSTLTVQNCRYDYMEKMGGGKESPRGMCNHIAGGLQNKQLDPHHGISSFMLLMKTSFIAMGEDVTFTDNIIAQQGGIIKRGRR